MAFKLDNLPTENQNKEKSFDVNTILKKEIKLFGNSFSNKKKEAFYIELNVLLAAGLTLKDGLALLVEEQKKEADKKLIGSIVNLLIEGRSFSDAIKVHKEFSEYEYYSLKIGEETGTLQKISKELGVFYKRKNEQRRTIISALSYPLVVLFTAFLAVFFMLQFVVPMFADIFKQNKVELPWITKVIMSSSEFFQKYYLFGLVFIIMVFVFIFFNKKKEWYRKYTSIIGLKIPLLNGIQLTKRMINYYPLQDALVHIEEDILLGKNLHESLSDYKVFDSKMVSLIKVAEETNQNETIFQRLTDQYNEEIQYKSKMISSTVEPFIILILGGIVAVILIAMYLPMFKLSTVIG